MAAEPQPFAVERKIVIQGGYLKHPWVPDTQLIDGVEVLTLSCTNRSLANALVVGKSGQSPFSDVSVINFLISKRDQSVDSFIARHQLDDLL